jgi:hypothetical protein
LASACWIGFIDAILQAVSRLLMGDGAEEPMPQTIHEWAIQQSDSNSLIFGLYMSFYFFR